ncbi:DUF7619 domain-containing protein [Flavobacterium sp. XGLA_31]|uniref:DUF7619 domain-containing protein n=1 Tax=Flavobacterium sp. XGLA_31 TaxID=3447666 RepID=UPI003F31353F
MKKQLLFSLLLLLSYTGFSKSLETTDTFNCPAPISVTVTQITFTSLTLNWLETGTATQWEVLMLPAGSPAPLPSTNGSIPLTANPAMITGLNPHTTYDFYVRSVCPGGEISDWSNLVSATTLSAPPVCGGNFVDSGDTIANYGNNENNTVTICPSIPGEAVRVTFSSFNTEAEHDALYVYNGNSMAAPQLSSSNPGGSVPGGLAGGYWGNSIPGPFTSTSADGCLTFRFVSDAATTLEGWTANVDCLPVICDVPSGLAVSSITESTAVFSWNSANLSFPTTVHILLNSNGLTNMYAVNATSNTIILPLTPNQCYTASISLPCNSSSGISDWSNTVSFCMVNCENNVSCPQSLVLNAFLDTNNNGVKDSGEINFNYGSFVYQVNNTGIPEYGYANNGSYYIFDQNPANSYDISFVVNDQFSGYYACTVSHNNITLPSGSGANMLYFPVVMTQPYNDVQVYVYPIGQPRPGFTYSNIIYYQNNSLQTIANGTLTFTKDPNLSIASISIPGTTATSDGFTYNFTNLAPFESRYIYVELLVPTIPTVTLGQLVTNSTSIAITNDANSSNNNSTITQTIVGSYDPNDKCEARGGKIVYTDFTASDYLYYTIQFENTGTANAEFVKVTDVLNYQLDETTFEMISASHPVNTKRDGNQLTWHFYNINLPPTTTNPADSHGYVHFKIKPKTGYALGDIIPNTASIYFDYNPAIITNTFNTEFVESLGTSTFSFNHIGLYPNPASNFVTVANQNLDEHLTTISIYDVLGKKVYHKNNIISEMTTIDTSHFAKGLYFVELVSGQNHKITKKLILK